MAFQFTPYIILNIVAGVVTLLIGYLIWQRRPGPGVNAFIGLTIFIAIQAFGGALEMAATTLPMKIIAVNIIYVGVVGVAPFWFAFVLGYTNRGHWLTKRTIALLFIHPIIVMSLIWTNDWHLLFWSERAIAMQDGLVVNTFVQGTLWYAHTAYAYLLLILSTVLLLRALLRSPQLYQGQVVFLLVGALVPTVGNFLFISGATPLPNYVDITPTMFLISGMAVGWALYRFRLMDIIPVARDTIIDNMADAVIVIDSANRVVDINARAIDIASFADESVIGRPLRHVFAAYEDIIESFTDAEEAEAEISLHTSSRARQPNDDYTLELRTYSMRLTPLHNQRGELTARIITLSDITALKQINHDLAIAREKADEATRLKSQFLANMSHELRTPLNAIIGYTELMLTGMVGDLSEKHYAYQGRVASNARHLLNLINDILDISKIEAGRMELFNQPLVLQTWLDEVVNQNAILAESKNLNFETYLDDSLPDIIMGDAARLRQVVTNLLSNAFKFTSNGSVTLRLLRNDTSTWRIEVEDTGIGIPSHEQETIFNEFQQVDGSSTREFSGTGLGLAIVRQFVLMMGGHIRVSSVVNEGSTFTVLLPLAEPENTLPITESANEQL